MVGIMGVMMLMPAEQSASSAPGRPAEQRAVRVDVGSRQSALKVDGSPVKASDVRSPESHASAASEPRMVIPTGAALVAAVLLLLPFGLSTLRIQRRKRPA